MEFALFNKFLNRQKKQEQGSIYSYSIFANVLTVYVPEEYVFPDFISTTQFLEKQDFYSDIEEIMLDFQQCKSLHGLGMGLEAQSYYECAKVVHKKVFWIGNKSMYKIILIMLGSERNSVDVIPYLSPVSDLAD